MTHAAVCIPSLGMSGHLLTDLLKVVGEEPVVDTVEVWINDFKPSPFWAEVFSSGVGLRNAHGKTIYQEFNAFAASHPEEHLVFLNDDIVLQPGDIGRLVTAVEGGGYGLVSGNDSPGGRRVREVSGTRRNGGIRSEAFVVGRGCWPPEGIDERFKIWYGDDDLLWKLEHAGHRIGVHEGVYVEHQHSTTSNQLDWVPAARVADGKLWHDELGRP